MSVFETIESRLSEIVAEKIAPHADRVDKEGLFPRHTIDALQSIELLGLVTPVEHGGLGGTMADGARVVEKIARACASSAMVVCMHYSGALVLAKHGSPEVNREIAQGRHLSTLAFSETGSRSQFWVSLGTARADGDSVVLDAQKSWSTSAGQATAYVFSTKPLSADGLTTLWLVPRETPGISTPGPFHGLGLRGNDSTPVTASGVRVPGSHQLGPDGGGFDIMMGIVLPGFNAMNAACSVGLMEAALAAASAHAAGTSFEHAGGSLAQLPTVRAQLARARVRADQARTLWEDTLVALTTGRADAMLRVLEVKASANDAAIEVTQAAMRICGGAAFRKEVGVERNFRDAQAGSVMGPTADVLYDFIGKAVTGLPLF
jgi:alkylation response protein AidB-like acyl-CoA dehydrogenase